MTNKQTKRLDKQVAWVSGGASGMGAAIAELFARQGARVTVADVQTKLGQQVAQNICRDGAKAIFTDCDVANEAAVKSSMDQTIAAFGGLTSIVNCAGIITIKRLHESSEADWDHMMGINLKSMFFSFKHGYDHLRRNRRSYIVNVGSVGSFSGQADSVSYIASKHGVLGLTRAIALDYAADGIRCNCICPGITDTPMLRFHLNTMPNPEEALEARLRRVPTGVAIQPLDIAKAALYLASEDSSGITGTMLTVDGGFTAAPEWQHPGQTAFQTGDRHGD